KVNPISLGHVATTTLLAALVLGTDRRSIFFRGVMIACAGVALWLLYKAGSRGPIVSLGACLAAYVLPRKTWAHPMAIAAAICGALGVLAVADLHFLAEALRFAEVGTDASSVEREQVIGAALQEFVKHPFLGSSCMLSDGNYPHNIFVDAAMAIGVPGL